MNLLAQYSIGQAVGCSAWLGGGFDWVLVGLWLRAICFCGAFVGLVVIAYLQNRVIREWKRENPQYNRKGVKSAGKPDHVAQRDDARRPNDPRSATKDQKNES